ncbi:MAG: FHIPEP family type III secretion protein [Planctomycetota bacterium]
MLDPRDAAAPDEAARTAGSRWLSGALAAFAFAAATAALLWTPSGAFGPALLVQLVASIGLLLWAHRSTGSTARHLFPWVLLAAAGARLGLQVLGLRLSLAEHDSGAWAARIGGLFAELHPLVAAGLLETLLGVQLVVVYKTYSRVQQATVRFEEVKKPERRQRIAAYRRGDLITAEDARQRLAILDRESLLLDRLGRAVAWLKLEAAAIAGLSIAAFTLAPLIGVAFLQLTPAEARVQSFLPVLGWSTLLCSAAMFSAVAVSVYALLLAAAHERSRGYLAYAMIRRVRTNRRSLLWVLSALGVAAALTALTQGVDATLPFGIIAALLAIPLAAELIEEQRLRTPRECGENEVEDLELEQNLLLQGREAPYRPAPIQLLYHASFEDSGLLAADAELVERRIDHQLTRVCRALGVAFPRPVLRRAREEFIDLRRNEYAILVRGVPVARGLGLESDEVLVLTDPARVRAAGCDCRTDALPGVLGLYAIVRREALPALLAHDQFAERTPEVLENLDLLLLHLDEVCRRNVRRFFGGPEVQRLVESLRRQASDRVDGVIPRLHSVQQVTELLQRLAEEGVPVRDLDLILSGLARHTQARPSQADLAEALRRELRMDLVEQLCGEQRRLPVVTLDPLIEEALVTGQLAPQQRDRVRNATRRALAELARQYPEIHRSTPTLLVRDNRARRALWEVLHQPNLPLVAVLSPEELHGVGVEVVAVTEVGARRPKSGEPQVRAAALDR